MSEGDPSAEAPPRPPGLRAALSRIAASGIGLVATRAELFSLEFAEERDRLTRRLGYVAAGGLLLAFAALFAGAFVIAMFWETHRLLAIAGVAFAHLVAGLVLLAKARGAGASAPPPFAASVEELRKDRELLERALAARESAS